MELFKKTFPNLYDIYTVLSKKKNLKLLTYFLIINLLFMFVEVIYGLLSNSLGLLTDGAHMLLDCTAVVIGLYSSYLSEFKSNNNYNYGYLRSEILGTFINSVFVFESIERFIEPKEIDSENLILVSFLGLVVNIIGLVFAHDHGDHDHDHGHDHSHEEKEKLKEEKHEHEHSHEKANKETHSHHHHEHKNENIYAIYVLISSFLVKYYKLYISDPICSLFISAMIIFSTIPVLKNASMSLLHIPNDKIIKKKKKIEQSIKSINCGSDNIKPIIGNFELWQTNSSYFVGEIKIEIDRNVKKDNKDKMLQNENSIFFEVQNKIQGIFKDNKINEYYIEIL